MTKVTCDLCRHEDARHSLELKSLQNSNADFAIYCDHCLLQKLKLLTQVYMDVLE